MADYTRLVATGLAAAGDAVYVWAPESPAVDYAAAQKVTPCDARVRVRRLPGGFAPHRLATLRIALDRLPRPLRILVQYVPHAFGCKAMNLPFCHWLLERGRRDEVWTLFHEVAYPVAWQQPLRHNLLGAVNRLMAMTVARASQRVFVTIPAWGEMLRPMLPAGRSAEWLPVPATLPTDVEPHAIATVRERFVGAAAGADGLIVGHFGTFGSHVGGLLGEVLPQLLLADHRRFGLLIGRGGPAFATELLARHPSLNGRLFATGGLPPSDAAAHVAACDALLQPYPDGVSCRRTTVMAGLALSVPIITNLGHLSEPIWSGSQAVALAPAPQVDLLVQAADRLLSDQRECADQRERGRRLYSERFDIRRTIETLRSPRPPRRERGA